MSIMPYRDRLSQYLQALSDPESPESRTSRERARAHQIEQRDLVLQAELDSGDVEYFFRCLMAFSQDDPGSFSSHWRITALHLAFKRDDTDPWFDRLFGQFFRDDRQSICAWVGGTHAEVAARKHAKRSVTEFRLKKAARH